MKNLELFNLNVKEMNVEDIREVNGGSELSEAIVRGVGYVSFKIARWFASIDWEDVSIDLSS